jgi:hypothetical protein
MLSEFIEMNKKLNLEPVLESPLKELLEKRLVISRSMLEKINLLKMPQVLSAPVANFQFNRLAKTLSALWEIEGNLFKTLEQHSGEYLPAYKQTSLSLVPMLIGPTLDQLILRSTGVFEELDPNLKMILLGRLPSLIYSKKYLQLSLEQKWPLIWSIFTIENKNFPQYLGLEMMLTLLETFEDPHQNKVLGSLALAKSTSILEALLSRWSSATNKPTIRGLRIVLNYFLENLLFSNDVQLLKALEQKGLVPVLLKIYKYMNMTASLTAGARMNGEEQQKFNLLFERANYFAKERSSAEALIQRIDILSRTHHWLSVSDGHVSPSAFGESILGACEKTLE